MTKNMGLTDRIIRFTLAIVIAALYFTHVITGTLALVLLIVVGAFIITSFFSFCSLYFPFGISTKSKSAN
jgi:fatty acid desaturase